MAAVHRCTTPRRAPRYRSGRRGARPRARRGAVPESVRVLDEIIERLTEAPLYRDNDVELLLDGPQTHDAMREAIASAEHHVHLETYIFADDEVGTEFAEALAAKAREGVAVRVIFDSHRQPRRRGRVLDGPRRRPASSCASSTRRIPCRTRIRSTSTRATIASCSSSTAASRSRAASTSTATTPAHQMSSAARARRRAGATRISRSAARPSRRFSSCSSDLWEQLDEPLAEPPYAPPPRRLDQGDTLVRVLSAVGGDGELSEIWVAYQAAAKVAADRIWITQSYFAPDDELMAAITEAAERGVDVRILVTGFSDSQLLLNASRAYYGDLLEAGVRVYESQEHIMHAKTMAVDGYWSTVGSSNLDYLSFLHNHEANAVILGAKFAAQLEDVFLADLENAVPIDAEQWRRALAVAAHQGARQYFIRYRL